MKVDEGQSRHGLQQHEPDRAEPSSRGRTEQQRHQRSSMFIQLELLIVQKKKKLRMKGSWSTRWAQGESERAPEQSVENVTQRRFSFNWGTADVKISSETQRAVKKSSLLLCFFCLFISLKPQCALLIVDEEDDGLCNVCVKSWLGKSRVRGGVSSHVIQKHIILQCSFYKRQRSKNQRDPAETFVFLSPVNSWVSFCVFLFWRVALHVMLHKSGLKVCFHFIIISTNTALYQYNNIEHLCNIC